MTRSDTTWWRVLVARARALVRPQRVHDEIEEELQFHLEMRVQEHMRGGMSEAEARQAAARAFGSVPIIKELSYDIRGGGWIEAMWRDVAYATRALLHQRTLSAVVIGIVAIGIGANAAILGVADRVLWRELPVRAPGELEELAPAGDLDGVSYPLYQMLRRDAGAFSGVFARWRQTSTFALDGEAERAVVELVSGNYFSVLGVQPATGRLLSDEDDRTVMGHPVAVVSDRYWRARFGGSASAIGRTIRIDDYPFTVVGVAPPKFFGVEVGVEPDAWVPLAMHPVVFDAHRSLVNDTWMWLDVLGRRAQGWSSAAAEVRASVVARRFQQSSGEAITSLTPGAMKLRPANRGLPRLRGSMTVPLTVLIGIVAFVLVIACANVATLVLVRSMARSREMGVRLALGASRARVMRQLLLENLLLASFGGLVGTLLAVGASRGLVGLLLPAVALSTIDVTPDVRLLVISLALTTITGILFGIAPAIRAARLDVASIIRGADRPRGRNRWRFGARPALVAGQIAVSLVLMIAAGLFAKSLERLASAPGGFDVDHVLMARISPTLNRYTPASALALYHALETRLSAVPGVRAVGTSAVPLLGGHANIITLWVPGRRKRSDPLSLLTHTVSGDFFDATGVRILRGRALDGHDTGAGAVPLVLNETAAREYFGDQDPVGRSARIMGQPATVVGVARDSKYRTMREAMPQIVYLTFDQNAFDAGLERTVYVRTAGDPAAFAPTLESAVHDLDRGLPVYDVRTLAEQRRRSMASERVVAWLSGLAAGVALLLAAIGLYGLVSFDAQLRTREIGVRISLGATRSRIMALVLRGALALLIAGTLGGLAVSLALSKLVSAQLYGVSPRDVTVAVAACALLSATAFVAASLPAWRAAGITPLEALRCE